MSKLSRMAFASAIFVCGFTATLQEAISAPKAIPMMNRYSKLKLDGICAANGGTSYGASGGFYGCTKGGNSVECDKNGNCTGYVNLQSGNVPANVTAEGVLAQAPAPASKTGNATIGGGATTAP